MSEVVSLAEALDILVDRIMLTYDLSPIKHKELRTVMLQVAASTASLMSKHFERMLPSRPAPLEPEEAAPGLPWKKPGSSNVH